MNCILDKSNWEQAELNNVSMHNCNMNKVKIHEITAKDWFLNQSVLDELVLDGINDGVEIKNLLLVASILTNAKIDNKVSIEDTESQASVILANDPGNKLFENLETSPLSWAENTICKATVDSIKNDQKIGLSKAVMSEVYNNEIPEERLITNLADHLSSTCIGFQPGFLITSNK